MEDIGQSKNASTNTSITPRQQELCGLARRLGTESGRRAKKSKVWSFGGDERTAAFAELEKHSIMKRYKLKQHELEFWWVDCFEEAWKSAFDAS